MIRARREEGCRRASGRAFWIFAKRWARERETRPCGLSPEGFGASVLGAPHDCFCGSGSSGSSLPVMVYVLPEPVCGARAAAEREEIPSNGGNQRSREERKLRGRVGV